MEQPLIEFLEKLGNKLQELDRIAGKLEDSSKQVTAPAPAAPAPPPAAATREQLATQLRKEMFWVYGVIVGFSLRQVMIDILPRVLPAWFVDPPQAVAPGSDTWWLESFRLLVFLLMITRFYLGAVVFFKNPRGEHIHDVSLGYVHFLIFFAWSLTLKSHAEGWFGLSAYLLVMGIVLLYDYAYKISPSWKKDSAHIRVWAARNLSTAVCSLAPSWILQNYYHANQWHVELLPLLLVLFVTVLDFYEMFKEKEPMFPKSLLKILP